MYIYIYIYVYIYIYIYRTITVWTLIFGIQEYTTQSKGIMQYYLEMHGKCRLCVW